MSDIYGVASLVQRGPWMAHGHVLNSSQTLLRHERITILELPLSWWERWSYFVVRGKQRGEICERSKQVSGSKHYVTRVTKLHIMPARRVTTKQAKQLHIIQASKMHMTEFWNLHIMQTRNLEIAQLERLHITESEMLHIIWAKWFYITLAGSKNIGHA